MGAYICTKECTFRTAECSHTHIKPQTHTLRWVKHCKHRSLFFPPSTAEAGSGRQDWICACVYVRERGSVRKCRAGLSGSASAPGRFALSQRCAGVERVPLSSWHRAGWDPASTATSSQSFIYRAKRAGIYPDCVCAEAYRQLMGHCRSLLFRIGNITHKVLLTHTRYISGGLAQQRRMGNTSSFIFY